VKIRLFEDQRVRYVAVGAYNTAFGYSLFALAHIAFPHVHYLITLLACHVIGILNAYTGYRLLVFRPEGRVIRDGLRFSIVYSAALPVNLVVLPLLVETAGLGVLVSQALIVVVTVIVTYVVHNNFTFRRPVSIVGYSDDDAGGAGVLGAASTTSRRD
jgi:putative flippase GtrA